jgi:predicted transcriptional regulator of viral defense system
MSTKAHKFFFEHKIFNIAQFVKAMRNPIPTCRIMLDQHLKAGNIIRIKQGLFAAIPQGADPAKYPVDPYAIISNVAPDALIAYHTALQFYGLAYSAEFQHVFQSTEKIRGFTFRQDRFKVTQYPKSLPTSKRFIFVETIDHHGFMIRVTSIERMLVDTLDRINLSGGLEEVWRSLNNIQSANIDHIVKYALLLNNATTIAKVGFYLRTRQQEWNISENYFARLKTHLPKSIHYLERNQRNKGRYIKEWKIVVPHELMEQKWEESLDAGDDI